MKPRVNQHVQQSRAAQRTAVDVHYSDDCDCRNCRRRRRKAETRDAAPASLVVSEPEEDQQ